QATRADDGSYALVYSASGKPFTVDLAKLSGPRLRASWYDPRTGVAKVIDTIPREGHREFRPPSQGQGHDWILILDDEAKSYSLPGQGSH
ncbi:putative collagen-binding domain-containing protein, partial [Singulisphaera rosea]